MPRPENYSTGTGGSGAVACPFYLARSDHELHCEGAIPDSKIINRFPRRADCSFQLNTYCCEHFRCCEIYRMLMREKYRE